MNERARAIIFLAIVLAITWILMNSITPLVIKTSGTKATVNKLVNVVSVSKTQCRRGHWHGDIRGWLWVDGLRNRH